MDFTPKVADLEKWKKHFVHMSENNSSHKNFYPIKPRTIGRGDPNIVMVSPTEQEVERAKYEMKYKSENLDDSSHSATRHRVSNISNKKRKYDGI